MPRAYTLAIGACHSGYITHLGCIAAFFFFFFSFFGCTSFFKAKVHAWPLVYSKPSNVQIWRAAKRCETPVDQSFWLSLPRQKRRTRGPKKRRKTVFFLLPVPGCSRSSKIATCLSKVVSELCTCLTARARLFIGELWVASELRTKAPLISPRLLIHTLDRVPPPKLLVMRVDPWQTRYSKLESAPHHSSDASMLVHQLRRRPAGTDGYMMP